ncbi:MAG: hypothetical protein MUC92_07980 [Fimbriimonadaceae bacterium]|jgi:hypothetical protein|nr:hypothetical protein [Fimbriimonadaceae bacterium]
MADFPLLQGTHRLGRVSWLERLPLVGSFVAYGRQLREEKALVNQAVERGPVPAEVWESRHYNPLIREKLETIVRDHAFPMQSQFHPDDPFELMMVLRYGDLNEVEIMMTIEEEFGIEFTPCLVQWLVNEQVTFLHFTQFVEDFSSGSPT